MPARTPGLILTCVFCTALAGCGNGGITVDGKLVKGDAPYTLADGEGVSVSLTSHDGKLSASGKAEKDGSFTIEQAGKPVSPGKYKVSVTRYDPAATPPTSSKAKTKGPPVSVTKTLPEEWDVSSSNHTFKIDLDKLK